MLEFLKKWLYRDAAQEDRRAGSSARRLEVFEKPQFDRRKRNQGEPVQPMAQQKPVPPPKPMPQSKPQPERVEVETSVAGRIEDAGPGKNVLVRSKYVREDTGTHETLKIVDDSLLETDDESGIDPYNTGKFDRSKNWDKRFFRK